jgi:hypothetical protein
LTYSAYTSIICLRRGLDWHENVLLGHHSAIFPCAGVPGARKAKSKGQELKGPQHTPIIYMEVWPRLGPPVEPVEVHVRQIKAIYTPVCVEEVMAERAPRNIEGMPNALAGILPYVMVITS